MPTKEELYEIYLVELEGTKRIEELKTSTWNMLKGMWYIRNIKENEEEKMLLNKCGICGGFLYEHTDLETANRYIYCPKCKEEHDKVKRRMTRERKVTRNVENKG